MTATFHREHLDRIPTVFVSSTSGMHKYREIVRQEVSRLGMWPDMYETWNENDIPPQEVCTRHILKSDIFVLLLGISHDHQASALSKSMTEFEYETAVSAGIPVLVYMKDHSTECEESMSFPFVDRVFSTRIVRFFSDEADLRIQIRRDLDCKGDV